MFVRHTEQVSGKPSLGRALSDDLALVARPGPFYFRRHE
jgi:hypothetical protein